MTTDAPVPYASGNWRVADGNVDAFIERWTDFLEWTSAHAPGFDGAHLLHDTNDAAHFISVARWESAEARQNWRGLDGFSERYAACRALCEDMNASDFVQVVDVR